MKNLIEYINECLDQQMVLELSSDTYKNAAEKANLNKQFDRAGKFMAAFYKAAEREKLEDNLVPDKYKGLKAKLEKVAPFNYDGFWCKFKSSDGEAYSGRVGIYSMYGEKSYGNVVIGLKEFQDVYAEMIEKANDDRDEIWRLENYGLKQKGLFFYELLRNTHSYGKDIKRTRPELDGINYLVPFVFDTNVSLRELEKHELGKNDKELYKNFLNLTNRSKNSANYYDPEHDVFYYIPRSYSSNGLLEGIIKYDLNNFNIKKIADEVENPIYKNAILETYNAMCKLLKVINPNSRFLGLD